MAIKVPVPIPPDPSSRPRLPWGIPLTFGAVVAALVIWRACSGRGEEATSASPASGARAEVRAQAAPKPPPQPRCTELSGEPFIIGEPAPRRAPALAPDPLAEAGPPDEVPEPIEDDLAPFAVEVGRGALFEGGFALGARRDAEGGAVAMVATLGLDGSAGKLVRLGRSRGDLDPPVVTGAGSAVLAALLEPNASGRAIKIAKVVGGEVTWGAELAEGRDDSLALDIAAAGPRALVAWDDLPQGEKRSRVMLASFDVATMRSVTTARPVTSPAIDADTPRLIARPGGYWLAYLARAPQVKAPVKPTANQGATSALPTGSAKAGAPRGDDRDDEGPSGEAIGYAWIEVAPLDENGAPTAAPRAVTPKDGHALAFDVELGEGSAAIIAWRDDDTPSGASGGRISTALVRPSGAVETRLVAEESFGAGVPDLLPGWLSVSGASGTTRIAALNDKGEIQGTLDPEPSLGTGEPLAASGDRVLVARPAGKAMRVAVLRCSPVPALISAPGASPSARPGAP
jgi:hypothetical protein